MSNMSYWRFTNTRADLDDCLEALRNDEGLNDFEVRAGRNMFMEFLDFCRDYDIISGYDSERMTDLFDSLRKKEEDDDT